MKKITAIAVFVFFTATSCVAQFAPHHHYSGTIIGENGDVLDTVKVLGLYLRFYSNGNMYTAGIASPDTLYNITFLDMANGGFKQVIEGAMEKSIIDREAANAELGTGWYRIRVNYIAGGDSAVATDGMPSPNTNYLKEIRVDIDGETHGIDSISADTIYIDGTWASSGTAQYADFSWWTLQYLPSNSLKYGTTAVGNVEWETTHNKIRAHNKYLNNYNIVSKAGGMIWRHDNWLSDFNSTQTSLASWHSVLDKHGVKSTSALNSQWEERWDGTGNKHAKFWRSLQSRGHEIASHGPIHQNHWWFIGTGNSTFTTDMPGVLRIGTGVTYDTVYLDTIPAGYGGSTYPLLTNDGLDIWLKRSKEMFAYIGLNPPTYWIEGGGLPVYFNPDSIYDSSWGNGYIGGGKYTNTYFQHMGFNSPWPGKSEYFMNWNAPESISISTDGAGNGPRNYTAPEAIKQLVDQSAKHTITIFRQHIHGVRISDWYLECMDSICEFAVKHPYAIRGWTGSEAARIVYQSETNPYINYIPSLDMNIDAAMGDTMPDGWTLGANAALHEAMTGSQSSLGCVSVGTGETTNLYLTRLYGIEKGVNEFTIDIKDAGANDTVYVEFTYNYGDKYSALSTAEINKAFPSTASWTTNTTEVTFPYNTSFVDIQVWSRTAESYVDELTLKKKY